MSDDPIDQNSFKSGPIAWMARNTVAANLLMILFLVGGLLISTQVKQEVFPEFTSDVVRVSVAYPGASPEEVEQGIILSVEDGVRGLEGVKRVTSTASEGVGTVVVELLNSADPSKVVQDVKNEVDRITSFPEDAERPVVSLEEIRRRVVSILIYGDQDLRALRDLAERVRDDLIQSAGVTLVELGMAPRPEIAIEVPLEKLRSYNLTIGEIADKIRKTALELPGGEVRTKGGQVLLRTQERRDYGLEFWDIPVATSDNGTLVRLSDIASVTDGFEESDEEAEYNGMPAILVEVFRVGRETPQSVSAAVNDYISRLKPELPDSVGIKIWQDRSEIYRDRMGLLLKNAAVGLILVLTLLGIFLEPRLAFWVTLGIPISVLGCFLFIPFTGASINMISLFAFIITLGIIVDDAVVAGENIFEKREQGMSPLKAAVEGAREVSMPITFAVLTNIVAFTPLLFVPGVSGKFFRQIPSVTIAIFVVSLIESLFVLPAHLSHAQKDNRFWRTLNRPREAFGSRLQDFIQRYYVPFIDKVVRQRYFTIALAFACLSVAVGMVAGGHLRFSYLPKIEADLVTVQANLPFGVPIEESRRVREHLLNSAKRTLAKTGGEEISEGLYTQIGKTLMAFGPGPSQRGVGGSHLVAAQVSLVPSGEREVGATEFARIWRQEVGELPGIESLSFRAETGANEGAAIQFNLSHRSREVTENAARDLKEIIRGYAGTYDFDDGVSSGKRQLSFTVSPDGHSLGVTPSVLGRQVRSAFYGAEALRQQRGRNEVKVMVRLPESERSTLETVDRLIIRTPSGGEMAFSEAAEIEEGRSYTEINRRDGRRIISVTAEVDDQVSNANQITSQIELDELPRLQQRYSGLKYSFGGEQEAQRDTMSALLVGFLLSMLVIYTLLAIPFKSYMQPLIVMLSIPFGFIGAAIGHFLLGYGLSIISMFGIIALSGVVVNDALVLVVTTNRLRATGLSAMESVKRAGTRRFRPIILTSLTTFFGLAPMIFETSVQARFLIPMAISLGFGILFATVITLVIVPSMYLVLEDIKQLFSSGGQDNEISEDMSLLSQNQA